MPKDTPQLLNGQIRVDIDERSYVFDTNTILATHPDDLSVEHVRDDLYSIIHRGKSISAVVDRTRPHQLVFTIGHTTYALDLMDHRLQLLETYGSKENGENHDGRIRAPMPGLVLKIHVAPGDTVKRNDALLVLEAMKMENEIRSPADGVVEAVLIRQGEPVLKNAPLLELNWALPTP